MYLTFEVEDLTFSANTPGRNRAALHYDPNEEQFTGVILMKDDKKIAVCCRLRTHKDDPVLEVTRPGPSPYWIFSSIYDLPGMV